MVILNIQHIVRDESKLGGKPHIDGTRMSVQQIAILHKSSEWSIERIAEEFSLTQAQIYAALAYYFDNQAEIDKQIKADDDLTRQVGTPLRNIGNQNDEA